MSDDTTTTSEATAEPIDTESQKRFKEYQDSFEAKFKIASEKESAFDEDLRMLLAKHIHGTPADIAAYFRPEGGGYEKMRDDAEIMVMFLRMVLDRKHGLGLDLRVALTAARTSAVCIRDLAARNIDMPARVDIVP